MSLDRSDASNAASDPPPPLGDRFEVRGELGRGAMGVVYRAYDRKLAREVALKRVATGSRGAKRGERMWREARAGAALRHPGVVAVHECLELPSGPCLVQELLDGAQPLSEVLVSGAPLVQRLEWVRQVVAAVAHAHARQVVHRDLKPENVLVDAEGRARVSDFGLAWHEGADALTRTNALLGTPSYMAPEQLGVGSGPVRAPTVDVWALGVLLYEAVALRVPFVGGTLIELMTSVANPPPPLRELEPEVSRGVEAVCRRALAFDPQDRYPDAEAMAEDLEQALGAGGGQRGSRVGGVGRALVLGCVLIGAAVALGVGASGGGGGALNPEPAAQPPAPPPAAPEASKAPTGWSLEPGANWRAIYGYQSEECYSSSESGRCAVQY